MRLCSATVSNTSSSCDFLVSQSVQSPARWGRSSPSIPPLTSVFTDDFDFTCGCCPLGSLLVHFYLDLLHDFGHTQAFVSCRVESHADISQLRALHFSHRCNNALFICRYVDGCTCNRPGDLNILFYFISFNWYKCRSFFALYSCCNDANVPPLWD